MYQHWRLKLSLPSLLLLLLILLLLHNSRSAVFPHGKRKTGVRVVSTRAVKHVAHLTDVHGTGGGDEGPLVRGCVLFVVNRADCERFRPCHEACPLFAVSTEAKNLRAAMC
jgi:DNA-binding sugar fermentation-stimulating protein